MAIHFPPLMNAASPLIKGEMGSVVGHTKRDQTHFIFVKQADGLITIGPGKQQSHSKSSSAGEREQN